MADNELPSRLRFDGGRMIKPNGNEIILKGVNFGSWGEDDPNDCPYIQSLGANCIRIALRFWGKWGTEVRENPDCRDNDAFAFMNRDKINHWLNMIESASAAGMWTVPFIDSNCGQSGTNTPEDVAYCDPKGTWGANGHNFYTDPSMRRLYAQIVWPTVAARLRLIPRVAMLEIHPEPAHGRGPEWAPLVAQVQKEVIDGIRSVDTDTPILLGARNGYSNALMEEALLALRDAFGGTLPTGLCWTGNLLNQWVVDPPRFDKAMHRLTKLRDDFNVPIYLQQVGRNSSEDPGLTFMRRAIEKMNEARAGFAWWQWKQNTSNPGNMGLNYKTPDGAGWIAKQDEISLLSEMMTGRAPARDVALED